MLRILELARARAIGKCIICGGEFTYYPSNRSGKFCSRECYFKHYRGENHPRYKGKVKINCDQCEEEFEIYPRKLEKSTNNFCSNECKAEWQREHLTEDNNPNFKGGDIELICEECGKSFKAKRWWTFRRFCSRECILKAEGKGKMTRNYICDNCGKGFYAKRSPDRGHYFCSKKCMGEYFTGENNPFHNGEFSKKSLKKIIKARHTRPNKPERKLIKIIERSKLPFTYVGNGEAIIGGKNPDFMHKNGAKKVIELFGVYWHSPIYGRVRHTSTRDAVKKHYKEKGYDCLIIWDTELVNPQNVENKILEFMECD